MTNFRVLKILFLLTIGYSETIFGQSDLYGEWEVFCPLEINDGMTTKYCDLCESENPNNKKLGKIIYGFEAKIDKDSIHLKNSAGTKAIKYAWDKKTRTIEFEYKQKSYKFISLSSGSPDNLILKDKDCLLLTFTKKKN